VRAALVGEQEARAGHDGRRAGGQRRAGRLPPGDAARRQHRRVARDRAQPRQRGERRLDAQDMASRLPTLGDQAVGAVGQRAAGLWLGADLVQDEHAGRAQPGDRARRAAAEQHDGGDLRLQAGSDVVAPHERQQQVRRQRAAGSERAGAAQLGRERPRVRHQPHGAEPAGRRHGAGQRRAGQPAAHPGLDDRALEPQASEQIHPRDRRTAASRSEIVATGR
jgi:hypothetical protein